MTRNGQRSFPFAMKMARQYHYESATLKDIGVVQQFLALVRSRFGKRGYAVQRFPVAIKSVKRLSGM